MRIIIVDDETTNGSVPLPDGILKLKGNSCALIRIQ